MKQLELSNTPLIGNGDRQPANHNQYEREQLKTELAHQTERYLTLQAVTALVSIIMLIITCGYVVIVKNLNLFTLSSFSAWLILFLVSLDLDN